MRKPSPQCSFIVVMVMLMKLRTYSELIKLQTFEERFNYLKLDGIVGQETFGFDRYLNQVFYKSKEWLHIRNIVIARDNACDLGVEGHDIYNRILIHHMNPISIDDILKRSDLLLNPEYLVTTIKRTHDAIHYGDENLIATGQIIRTPNDTCPWKH